MNVQQNVPLAPYTSLHVGGPAKTLLEVAGNELKAALAQAQKPLWVLGFGSNCLISDKGLAGTVVICRTGEITPLSPTTLKVESGASWDNFVQKTIGLQLYGLEFTSGIPGSVGAAVAGNIAAYGQKVADCLVEATIMDVSTGVVSAWSKADFAFAYRSSALQQPQHKDCVVIDATFECSATPTAELEYNSALTVAKDLGLQADSLANRRAVILETRKRAGSLLSDTAKGPWTAGSFFKNPLVNTEQVEAIIAHEEAGVSKEQLLRQNQIHGGSDVRVSAAHVLLAAGFKRGQSWGQVRLHPDHILKVENVGQATAQEIYAVIQEIITTVREKLGIILEPEVRFLGEF